VVHLAAETHVDRSIVGPMRFVETNVVGTVVLLNAALSFREGDDFRFLHVSTDEVFGDLGTEGLFSEESRYQPSSPYSASKAASDHLVRAWHRTYGLPAMIINCTNNYGPFQFPEKLIPLTITRARTADTVPIYGDGTNVRDWLFVIDHCDALLSALEKGIVGETYCIGGDAAVENLSLVRKVLDEVDRQLGRAAGTGQDLIRFVEDRPGHDHRYAMDITKAGEQLGWAPSVDLDEGIERTVAWYLGNEEWVREVESESSVSFAETWYRARGGAKGSAT
jgi:dTDP-glucose 4,6-dehydratase